MVSVTCLKVVGSYSYLYLCGGIVRWCEFSFINYAPCQTFSVSWAVHALSRSAVAEFFVVLIKSVGVFFQNYFILLV